MTFCFFLFIIFLNLFFFNFDNLYVLSLIFSRIFNEHTYKKFPELGWTYFLLTVLEKSYAQILGGDICVWEYCEFEMQEPWMPTLEGMKYFYHNSIWTQQTCINKLFYQQKINMILDSLYRIILKYLAVTLRIWYFWSRWVKKYIKIIKIVAIASPIVPCLRPSDLFLFVDVVLQSLKFA